MFKRLILFLAFVTLARTSAAQLGAAFGANRTRLGISGGYGSFNNQNYLVLGVGVGYYVLEGLETGLDAEGWLGSRPHIYKVSPQVTYILPLATDWKPYIGGFFKRTFYDSALKNANSLGGRAGLTAPVSDHASISGGLVYEKLLNCDSQLYAHCSLVYPELGVALSY